MPIFPEKDFFFPRKLMNTPCSFHSCISTFQKSKLDVNPLMKYESAAFSDPKWLLCHKPRNVLEKLLTWCWCTSWSLSLCKILKKKTIVRIQSYEKASFFDQKWSNYPKNNFSENPLIYFVLFIYFYLQSNYQSQMSIHYEMLIIKEHWNLIGRSIFGHNLSTKIFPSM